MVRERKGFTLIELLVDIAVIAFLLAILMPALRAARAQGQMAACSAQLRQFGLAWSQYADDNDAFNIEYAPSSQWASGGFWFCQLGPYFSAKDFAKGQGDTRSGVLLKTPQNCPTWEVQKAAFISAPAALSPQALSSPA